MTLISTTYDAVRLDLAAWSDEKKELWKKNPVHLTETEMKALALDSIIPILKGNDCSPTALAGIRVDQIIFPLLKSMKNEYERALITYKESLKVAMKADQDKINELSEHLMKEDFWVFWPIVSFLSANKMKFIEKGEYIREVQAHRYKWLIEVGCFEKSRLNRVKMQLELAVPKVIEDLKTMREQLEADQSHKQLCMQAWQLKKVYQTLFPNSIQEKILQLQHLLPSDEEMSKDLVGVKEV